MTAWLAARTPGVPGSAAWLAGLPGALEMAGWSRSGLLAGGLYADALTQTACAVLALGEAAVEEGGDPPVRGR
ncbi:MAG: hypothetical protein MUC63_11240 [Planctomycetes bacterium]|nr:hypothetical protein [Planctomycetota bacterium]